MAVTDSWINIRYSVERIFQDFLAQTAPTLPFFRFAPPDEAQAQLALVTDRALFVQVVPGEVSRNQQTYATAYLLRVWDKSKYIAAFGVDTWILEMSNRLQAYLNRGEATFRNFFPLYDVESLLPVGAVDSMLADGDVSTIAANLPTLPPAVDNTGFFVRSGHTKPALKVKTSPMVWEMPLVFEHYAFDTWQDQRGN